MQLQQLRGCCLSCTLITSSAPKIPFLGAVLWSLKKPYAEIWKFLTDICSGTAICVCCFKYGRNWCRISVRKAALYWWQKTKHILAPFGGIPGAISRKFFLWVRPVVLHLYSGFHPFRFGGVITLKPFHDPQSENNIGFLEPINNYCHILC